MLRHFCIISRLRMSITRKRVRTCQYFGSFVAPILIGVCIDTQSISNANRECHTMFSLFCSASKPTPSYGWDSVNRTAAGLYFSKRYWLYPGVNCTDMLALIKRTVELQRDFQGLTTDCVSIAKIPLHRFYTKVHSGLDSKWPHILSESRSGYQHLTRIQVDSCVYN